MKHFVLLLTTVITFQVVRAQFSTSPLSPYEICTEANTQNGVLALNDSFTSKKGYFVFWLDRRAGDAAVYGQRLDTAGNKLWESQGRLMAKGSTQIFFYTVIPWQQGMLLTYVIGQDSVMSMYLDSNGHNNWVSPSLIARKESPVIYVTGTGCLQNIATSTGATVTYAPVFLGGSTAIAYNQIDFNGNVLLANNAKTYALSGYDYRAIGDGADGFYALSKGNGIGSTMTIDRINATGTKTWASGVEITGGSNQGFGGNISMEINAGHDLYVAWHSANNNVQIAKVLSNGTMGWAFGRLALSTMMPANASRSFMRLKEDTAYVTWLETVGESGTTRFQKVGADGGLSLPAGGMPIGNANYYYSYPKLAFNNQKAVAFFGTTTQTVAVAAQSVTPQNTLDWGGLKLLGNVYLKWIAYSDFAVMDNDHDCNVIFWAGFDGNIYAASTCRISSILPVKAGTLHAENFGTRNKISWEGYNQQAGDSYEIERSQDGTAFTSIGKLFSTGTSKEYIFWDEAPNIGVNYYRIKMQNNTGTVLYSNVVKLSVRGKSFVVTAYPNPVKNILQLNTGVRPVKNASISIIDFSGKTLNSFAVNNSTFSIDMSVYKPGAYLLKYTDEENSSVVRIQKQ